MTDLAVVDGGTGEIISQYVGPLAALRNAHTMLERASSLDEVKKLRDQAEALRTYCDAAGMGLAMQNECAELKLRAERKAGEMLAATVEHGGDRRSASKSQGATLKDLDINRSQSSRWQRIASIPEPEFDAYIAETVTSNRELTTSGALQLARSVAAQDPVIRPDLRVVHDGEGLPGMAGSFRTIVADPPWRYGNTSTRNAADKHYPTMSVDELCELPVEAHAAAESHLYLWATAPLLREAFTVMEAWGFTYKTNLVWVKPQMGMGNYFRVSHEHVLFGIRGKAPTTSKSQMSWFLADRTGHSAKPDSFIDIVERCSPGPGLEMFARRDGRTPRMDTDFAWSYWGNEA